MKDATGKPSLLISLGGNALNPSDAHHPHQREEFKSVERCMEDVISLVEMGYTRMALCHGNGPQVGQIYMQQELTRHETPRQVTLDVCVADSQGRIGYILQNVLDNVCLKRGLTRKALAIITQVVVDRKDPGFENPSKPIGMFYSQEEAEQLQRERGWKMKEDAGRGFRRVVPSPVPREIVEHSFFREILGHGFIPIGGGGGGIPVVRMPDGSLEGVEGVVDKDFTSALLAQEMEIELLVILTAVEYVYLGFDSETPRPLEKITANELETHLRAGEFSEGSMKPKVEAALYFLKNGGKKAIITHLDHLIPAMNGETGTHIVSN